VGVGAQQVAHRGRPLARGRRHVWRVAAALAGWGVVTLVDQLANGELVARIVLLCVGGVLLVGLLAPACWHRGRGTTVALLAKQVAAARDDGEGLREFTLPLPSVVSPDGKGKLRFVLNV
jgi:hypothetical protein